MPGARCSPPRWPRRSSTRRLAICTATSSSTSRWTCPRATPGSSPWEWAASTPASSRAPGAEARGHSAPMRLTLARGVSLAVLASARTEAEHHEDLGCSIQGPTARPVRQAHVLLKQWLAELGPERSLREAKSLVRWLEETPRYAALRDGDKRR